MVSTYIFLPLHMIEVAGGIPSGCVGFREVAIVVYQVVVASIPLAA